MKISNAKPDHGRELSEEELKKLGIHLTESILSEEHKDAKWDEVFLSLYDNIMVFIINLL